jgi:hypothetical protein
MWHVWGRGEVCIGVWWGNLRERNHLEDPGLVVRLILKCLKESGWTGLIWLRIGTIVGLLWTRS